jgi:DNA-binding PadR family transcriptional regulator
MNSLSRSREGFPVQPDEHPRRHCTSSIRIRGLAERAGSPDRPLGPEVIVPEQVPLLVESSPPETIGTAALRRDERGIWCEAEIWFDGHGEQAAAMRDRHPAEQWPKLAVGIERALVEKGVITAGRVTSVSLVRENFDPGLPPWEVVTDPSGECGICGTVLDYRARFLRRDGRWTGEKVPDPYCPRCDDDLEHLCQLTSTDLKFCGCGDPGAVYDLIRDLLGLIAEKWADDGHDHWREVSQKITDLIGGGTGTYYAVLYWLDGSGLIEHGGSVGGSWLTEKGKHYLSLMRLHEHDEMDGPGCTAYGLPHDGNGCGPGCRHWEASTEEWRKQELARAAKP